MSERLNFLLMDEWAIQSLPRSKERMAPQAVLCCWQWQAPRWVLAESFVADDEGQNLHPGDGDSNDANDWLFTPGEGDDLIPIPGRAVTLWTVQHGVRLLDINPPDHPAWLQIDFCERLRKMPDWSLFIEDGCTLSLGTAREAGKYLTLRESP